MNVLRIVELESAVRPVERQSDGGVVCKLSDGLWPGAERQGEQRDFAGIIGASLSSRATGEPQINR
jgi:hypothetical protein